MQLLNILYILSTFVEGNAYNLLFCYVVLKHCRVMKQVDMPSGLGGGGNGIK